MDTKEMRVNTGVLTSQARARPAVAHARQRLKFRLSLYNGEETRERYDIRREVGCKGDTIGLNGGEVKSVPKQGRPSRNMPRNKVTHILSHRQLITFETRNPQRWQNAHCTTMCAVCQRGNTPAPTGA